MAIFNVAGEWDSINEQSLHPGHQCFKCGRILDSDILVYVLGFPYSGGSFAQIWLHIDCALQLAEDWR
jgi:hypothetical protein